jgi:hypothetical protein
LGIQGHELGIKRKGLGVQGAEAGQGQKLNSEARSGDTGAGRRDTGSYLEIQQELRIQEQRLRIGAEAGAGNKGAEA